MLAGRKDQELGRYTPKLISPILVHHDQRVERLVNVTLSFCANCLSMMLGRNKGVNVKAS